MTWPTRIKFTTAERAALRAAAPLREADLADPDLQRRLLREGCARLPALKQTLDAMVAVVHQTGAVIAAATPLDDAVLVAVASLFGRVSAEGNGPPPGRLVHNLFASPQSGYDLAALPLHTDSAFAASPQPYLGLACVQPSKYDDGLTILARADHVAARVGELNQRHLRLLQDRCYPFAKLRGQAAKDPHSPVVKPVRTAILTRQGTEVMTVFHSQHVREGIQLQPSAVDAEHRAALDTFESVLAEPGLAASTRLESGDLLLADNRRVLHGRSAVHGSDSQRHMKRLKVSA